MRSLLSVVLSLALCFAFAGRATGQCAPIPGTGCPGQTAPVCGTPPVIGTNFIFRCAPSCFPSIAQFIIVGTPMPPLPVPAPPACAPGCTLACQPLATIPAPGLTLAIPPNPALIGLQLCIQCACQPAGSVCFNLTMALSATIQ